MDYCSKKFGTDEKLFYAHMADDTHHTIDELLTFGVDGWHYKQNGCIGIREAFDWCVKRNYIVVMTEGIEKPEDALPVFKIHRNCKPEKEMSFEDYMRESEIW